MSRICDIIESDEYYEASTVTQLYFDFLYELITDYQRYEADMRISGLYYRTSKVDMAAMNDAARFIELNRQCDFRMAAQTLSQRTQNRSSNQTYIETMDEVFCEIAEDKDVTEFPHEFCNLLRFKREPKNTYDKNAIQVFFRDVHCGYVPKEHAAILVSKYSTKDIEDAVGIIRKNVGDARVTFDLYLPGPNSERSLSVLKADPKWQASPKFVEDEEDDELEDAISKLMDWEDEDECEEPKKKMANKPVNDTAETKIATTAYVESITQAATKPESPVKGTMVLTVNGNAEIYNGSEWVEIAPLASPVFTGKAVKAQKPLPTPLDYTQYTGFLRTVLEYATFAHVR